MQGKQLSVVVVPEQIQHSSRKLQADLRLVWLTWEQTDHKKIPFAAAFSSSRGCTQNIWIRATAWHPPKETFDSLLNISPSMRMLLSCLCFVDVCPPVLECLIISKKFCSVIQRLLYSWGVNHLSVHKWINVICLTFKLEIRITVGPGRPAKGSGK